MEKRDHKDIKIDRRHETRTKEISNMIDEGGLGADKYYKIKKDASDEDEKSGASDSLFSQ